MAKLLEIEDKTFDQEVLQADMPVLVDFGAVWCGPCKMLDPVVEELADDWAVQAKFVHIDVDHNPNVTMQFSVMGVPTLMLFKNGEPVERMSGFKPKNKIISQFGPHLD